MHAAFLVPDALWATREPLLHRELGERAKVTSLHLPLI
jgi:hypothetical protein